MADAWRHPAGRLALCVDDTAAAHGRVDVLLDNAGASEATRSRI
jgi:hypothetical protein